MTPEMSVTISVVYMAVAARPDGGQQCSMALGFSKEGNNDVINPPFSPS